MSSVNKKNDADSKNMNLDDPVFLDSFFMEGLTMPRGISDEESDSYQDAFDLFFEVWKLPTKAKRTAMAKKILKMSPYVLDARLLLIEEDMKDISKKIKACEKAVSLGKKFVGKKALKEFHGEMWGYIDARPMMRAMEQLAELYRENGQDEDSLTLYKDILDMNKNDNQGMRYEVLPFLMENSKWEEARILYSTYEDEYLAMWHYMGALIDYVQGDEDAALKKIKKGHSQNKHYLPWMLGLKSLPKNSSLPDFYSPGDGREARAFVRDVYDAWNSANGAMVWFREHKSIIGLSSVITE